MTRYQSQFSIPCQYPVYFEHHVWSSQNTVLETVMREGNVRKVQIIAEEKILDGFPALPAQIQAKIDPLVSCCTPATPLIIRTAGGESSKEIECALKLCRQFEEAGLCRHSAVIAIGGGAFLDVVGFAAALTHRGIRLIRMPTTTLSQADSGVGVKNGVNAFGKKNFIGTFQPPFAVINDFIFLSALPSQEWVAGIPEALKVSLIKDKTFFNWLILQGKKLKNRDQSVMETMIERSAVCHLNHIASGGDPFETGSARPLDFGHWAAHKLETMSQYRIGHGSAVATGILIDAAIAVQRGLIAEFLFQQIHDFFSFLEFDVFPAELSEFLPNGSPAILKGLEEFREHLGGDLQITLPNGIGSLIQTDYIDDNEVITALKKMSEIKK